ncbi:MAG: CDP-alcohol phosphatidyltransferase family protein [Chloroflexi bacterium]|nr:CDP-alcohol phosphatidyltransferase family protein [Chloroflexota bacterium]
MTRSHGLVPTVLARGTRSVIAPAARGLAALGLGANAVTVIGFAITVGGSAILAQANPALALPLLALGTVCDALDGQVARIRGGGTPFGAFLDSTLDRLADGALSAAPIVLGARTGDDALLYGGIAALIASFLVSYTRARAEGLGARGDLGAAPREARIVLFLIGVAAWAASGSRLPFTAAVLAIAVLASVTLLTRIAHASRVLGKEL